MRGQALTQNKYDHHRVVEHHESDECVYRCFRPLCTRVKVEMPQQESQEEELISKLDKVVALSTVWLDSEQRDEVENLQCCHHSEDR